jgi:hypothetical protein
MTWDTAGDIVNDAAVELGLISFQGRLSDPFTPTDTNIGLLCQLMKSLGRTLRQARQWSQLTNECTITTVADQEAYALPADFGAMIDQSGWNRTKRFPLTGPATPQEWQYLEASTAGPVLSVVFRPLRGSLYIYNAPAAQSITFEYSSTYWVQQSGETAPNTDGPENSADLIWFDGDLVSRGLKFAYLKNKGFDYTAAEREFDEKLQLALSDDAAAPVLRLSGRSGTRLLDENNLPSTGYG